MVSKNAIGGEALPTVQTVTGPPVSFDAISAMFALLRRAGADKRAGIGPANTRPRTSFIAPAPAQRYSSF